MPSFQDYCEKVLKGRHIPTQGFIPVGTETVSTETVDADAVDTDAVDASAQS